MRILKLYVDNFKGVTKPTIIDFENEISILNGPNGFGKTTIFDAIELCITGEIYRTSELKGVTEDRQDYTDAFYRNKKNKDMVLNLLVEGYNQQRFTIVKVLPANSTGRVNEQVNTTRYKVAEWGIIATYLGGEEDFAKNSLVISDQRRQEDVASALLGPEKGNLKELYRLFAYLQQAENTFYLKKSEKQRKAELNHLFGTDTEAAIKKKLDDRLTKLNEFDLTLQGKINGLGNVKDDNQEFEYVKLIEQDNQRFDTENPYRGVDIEQIDTKHQEFRDRVIEIEKFLSVFDPEVYKRNKVKQSILRLSESTLFLDYLVLRDLLEDETYSKLTELANLKKFVKSESFLQYFILQKFVTSESITKYENDTKQYLQYNNFRKAEDKPLTVEAKLGQLITWESLSSENITLIRQYILQLEESAKALDTTQASMTDLIEIRESLTDVFSSLPETHSETDSCECPLCGFNWKNINQLMKEIDSKTEKINTFLNEKIKSINRLKKKIEEDFLNDFENSIDNYLAQNRAKYNFLQVLKKLYRAANQYQFVMYKDLLETFASETSGYVWAEPKTAKELESDMTNLSNVLRQKSIIDDEVFGRISKLRGYKYEDSVKQLSDLEIKIEEAWQFEKLGDESELDAKVDKMKVRLTEIAHAIEIDTEKLAGNLSYMYKDYFAEAPEKLQETAQKLKPKLQYLESEYQNNRRLAYRVLVERHKKIKLVRDVTKETKQKYENVLKSYKREMIEKIRLPFYIYSAKVLQNYQQGMGVFIASSNSNSDAIRFITESESNHDVVHHLSSGQLAVVSIAFTFAINKVYGNTSLGVLAIDDPVYELDGLNVHSFVELIRRSFMGRFQIILSTHDDDSAKYMKYRFEKLKKDSVKLISVQNVFYGIDANSNS